MNFNSLIELMNREIALFEQLQQLYSAKKDILIKNDFKSLRDIDNKIIDLTETIKSLEIKRIKVTNNNYSNMSSIINYAKVIAPEYVEKLEIQQRKIKKLIKNITNLNQTNIELIHYGLHLSESSISFVIKLFQKKSQNYTSKCNCLGYTPISTIITEA